MKIINKELIDRFITKHADSSNAVLRWINQIEEAKITTPKDKVMKKKFESVSELTSREEYNYAMTYVMQLINEATANGALSDPEADNEYIREIGRVGHLCAVYEDTKIEFKNIKIRKKTPLIRSIEDEMYSRNIKQKELARMLGINEPTLSQIMGGKRSVSMRTAKRLHKYLNIDAKVLIEYA